MGETPKRLALDKLAAAMPDDRPLLISEIGAEALNGFRDPLKTYWSEGYQPDLLKEWSMNTANPPGMPLPVF